MMDITTVVIYSPITVGKKPVNAVPTPRRAKASKAKGCSAISNNIKITANDKNPGISRSDWRMPISAPVKAARSMEKLLINAIQVFRLSGMAIAINSNSSSGRRHSFTVSTEG